MRPFLRVSPNLPSAPTAASHFLASGGEMGARMRAHDWAATPLGPPDTWPQPLRLALSLCLHSSFPTAIYWGPDLRLLYNDAWAPIPAERHPWALGRPAREVWSDIWDVIEPQFAHVFSAGDGFSTFDQMLPMVRNGVAHETYWIYSFTPIRDEQGAVVGILNQGHETTGRVLAERRREAELDRQRRMFEQAPGFMAMLHGPDHCFELVNPAYQRLIGDRDVLGKPAAEALPEAAGQGYIELLDSVFRSGEPYRARGSKFNMQVVSGGPVSERYLDFVYQPVFDDAGKVTGIFVEGYDVTETYLAQQALRESEAALKQSREELQLLTDALPVLVSYLEAADGGLRYSFVNRIYEAWFPRRREDIQGKLVSEVIGDEAYAAVKPWIDRALAGERVTFEQFMLYKDRPRHIRAEYVPRIAEGGGVEGVYALVQDITEAKQAEAAVHESESRLRRVLDQLFAFVGVLSPDGVLVDINRAPMEAAGIDAEDVLGKPFWDTYWWSYDREVQARLKDAVTRAAAGETVRYDVPICMAGRTLLTVDFQIAPLRDERGQITHLIPSATVIEDRVRAQRELEALNATLEQRIAAAVADLEQAQEALRQSQKLESMGQLTGGVAHDFNNLLTPIIASLDLLQIRGTGDERTQRLIAGALQSAEKAKTLVQRLLAFARRQPLQPTAVDLPRLVQGMAELVASTSGPRVKVMVDVPDNLPAVRADQNQLEMAILNLAVNARDAMPDGGKLRIAATTETVSAGHASKLAPGAYVRLMVADTGTGMDAETVRRAVEPFFSTKGIGKGTGLGLSMVHGLMAQLGGALTIRSRPGVGTSIELWLPFAGGAASAPEPTGDVPAPAGTGAALLVDDEDLVRVSTADMLQDLGYTVVEASSAEEALKLIAGGLAFDLLMTDHLMPGMTGTDLAREVRALRPGVPVLIVSGYAEDEGIAPDLPRLTKPFRRADLVASLAELTEPG
jgi:PAS domain S-box-containing protein